MDSTQTASQPTSVDEPKTPDLGNECTHIHLSVNGVSVFSFAKRRMDFGDPVALVQRELESDVEIGVERMVASFRNGLGIWAWLLTSCVVSRPACR